MPTPGNITNNRTTPDTSSYANRPPSKHSGIKQAFNISTFSPASELKPSLNNLSQQYLRQIGLPVRTELKGARGNDGSPDWKGLAEAQLAKGPVTNARPGGRVRNTTSYTQPFINNNVNNLIREIQTVRPGFQYNRVVQIGTPYNQNDINTLTDTRNKIKASLLSQLPQSDANSFVVQNMYLASLNDRVDQIQFRTYQANGGKAGFQEWLTEKPTSPDKSRLASDLSAPIPNKKVTQIMANPPSDFYELVMDVDHIDCNDIATYLYRISEHQGKILDLQNPNGKLFVHEFGKLEEFYDHRIYTDGNFIFDPRFSWEPQPSGQYLNHIKSNNTGLQIRDVTP